MVILKNLLGYSCRGFFFPSGDIYLFIFIYLMFAFVHEGVYPPLPPVKDVDFNLLRDEVSQTLCIQ